MSYDIEFNRGEDEEIFAVVGVMGMACIHTLMEDFEMVCDDRPGIPSRRFTGVVWVAPAEECAAALATWETLAASDDGAQARAHVSALLPGREDIWNEWITFLTKAVDRDGFTIS